MRILVIAPHPFFQERGTPLAERALIEVLSGEGHEVHVATYHEGENVEFPGCRIHRIPRIPGVSGIKPGLSWKKLVADFFLTFHVVRLLRRLDIDVVHAVEEGAFIALIAKRLFGLPYVYDMDSALTAQATEQWPVLRPVRRLMRHLERRVIRQSLYVLAVCKLLEERARELVPGQATARLEDVSLLPPSSGSRPEVLSQTIGHPGPIVMYVGNLESYQGIDLLVAGFQELHDRVPEAQLVVIGGRDRHIALYRAEAEQRGIGDQAHFLGPRPHAHLRDYLEQAAVLISPRSSGVNTPLKVYSYLDSGRPVAATRLPTHTQVLDDEIAMLFEPTPEDLANALERLLTDRHLGDALAGRAQKRAAEEFSPAAFRRKLSRFYEKVERKVGAAAEPRDAHGDKQPALRPVTSDRPSQAPGSRSTEAGQ